MDDNTPHSGFRIGFDAKRANANNTGLGNYSRFIIDALASSHPTLELKLYVPKHREHAAYNALLHYPQVSEVQPHGVWSAAGSLWRSFGMAGAARRDGVDLFHGLSAELPAGLARRGIRSVVTIHDLIFLRYPEFYKPIDRMIYERKFRHACRAADRIVAVSECTKRDIVNFFGTDPVRIDVIYQGCSPAFSRPIDEQERARVREVHHLPERFLLNVGSLESRKNLMLAVKALRSLPADMHLVAVGRRTKYADQVEEYARRAGVADRLHLLSGVSFSELLAIYHAAEVFVYPSFFEGFGIPIIEAIRAGLPVVAATGSCLEEAGGADCIYVDPNDDHALAQAVVRVVTDDALRQTMVTRSQEYIRRFEPQEIATQMAALYERVMREATR